MTRAAPYFFLAVFAFALLWPLCCGRALYWGDILLYFEPMQQFARHELSAGRLPLWNPYISCGQPYIGNPQMNIFYPSTLLLLCCPVWLAMSINAILHLFLCGAFMYMFLRRWTVHTVPAFAGAVVYMGSAHILGRLQFPPMVQTAAYFPLLFAVLDANVDRPGLRNRLILSVTVTATLLAAHTQVAYLAFGSGTIYTLMRLWRRRQIQPLMNAGGMRIGRRDHATGFVRELWSTMRRSAPLAAAGVFGLLLAAIYLLPAIQLLHESSREKMTVSQANRFFADFPHLLAVFFPRFTGHPITRDFWARGNAWEPAWFVGWTPLALAGYAILRCRNENLVRFWLAIGLTGFWFAFGIVGGLFWVAFYTVPGVATFHDPARFLLWTTVAVSALAAIGLDALQVRLRWPRYGPGLLVVASIVAPLVWFAGDWLPTTSPRNLDLRPAGLTAIRGASAPDRIIVPANTLYWKRVIGDGYIDYGNGDRKAVQRAVNTLISNLDMRNGLESASGYEPVPVGSYAAMDSLNSLAQQRREPNTSHLLGLLDVRLMLLPRTGATPVAGYHQGEYPDLRRSPLSGWKAAAPISRAWLTRSIRRVEGRTRVSAALAAPGFDPSRTTLVSLGSNNALGDLAPLASTYDNSAAGPAAWHSEGPGRIRLTPDAGISPAFLVYSGTAYPGWKATVDGRKTALTCADGTLIGLLIPPRRHEALLTYAPDMFRIGAYLSLAALSAAVALAVMGFIVRRRSLPDHWSP